MTTVPGLPTTQRVALVRKLGGAVEFVDDYPVPKLGPNEVLAKVLYTGVCQSDLHTMRGTAASPTGENITNIKLPHIGGHEGVGRIVAVGPEVLPHRGIREGNLVGIRFISRICRRCEFCLAGEEQHCQGGMTNHLHHEDGAFQQYIALDAGNLTLLPDDIDEAGIGPVLCAGITAYKVNFRPRQLLTQCVMSCGLKPGQYCVVIGAGGGTSRVGFSLIIAHLVQYAKVIGARVIAVDANDKRAFCMGLGAHEFFDFRRGDLIDRIHGMSGGGAHAVVVTTGNAKGYAQAADMLRIGGTMACGGIPPGKPFLETSIGKIVIHGLQIKGSLVGNLKETMEAVELSRQGRVKVAYTVRPFKDLPQVYEELERDAVLGRVILKIAEDE